MEPQRASALIKRLHTLLPTPEANVRQRVPIWMGQNLTDPRCVCAHPPVICSPIHTYIHTPPRIARPPQAREARPGPGLAGRPPLDARPLCGARGGWWWGGGRGGRECQAGRHRGNSPPKGRLTGYSYLFVSLFIYLFIYLCTPSILHFPRTGKSALGAGGRVRAAPRDGRGG